MNHLLVTERQLVIDSLLLLQSLESSTFTRLGHYFIIRKPVSLSHTTPNTLKSILLDILSISNIYEEVKGMATALEDAAGTVVQRLKHETGMVLDSF